MRRIAFFTIITLLLVSCAGKVAPTPEGYVNPDNKKEWKMIWNDEFDYQTRDQLLQVWDSSNAPTSHTVYLQT